MRIDRIELQNFKRFEHKTINLHPHFTLLVGDNGAGKTTVLDALAIAAGIWLVNPPDSALVNSGRSIEPGEIRLELVTDGDRSRFQERKPVWIEAEGQIAGHPVCWRRQIQEDGVRTTNRAAENALSLIAEVIRRDGEGEDVLCPVLGYYGAGRAWLPSNTRTPGEGNGNGPARRWQAFYGCFDERIRLSDLQNWFQREVIASANRGGRWRPGYEAVKQAVLHCIPGGEDLWFDGDRGEIVLRIDGTAQPFGNLSAGQKMMVALIADIAVKAVTQNAHLLPELELGPEDHPVPRLLLQTPGLILIDELDVHLHPNWQRRVVDNLKETFPAIQFVCTSHSPFVIQSIQSGELRILDDTDLVPVDYANKSIEDIAEDVQQVEVPQQSVKARELAEAAGHYFTLLEGRGSDESAELVEAEHSYRMAASRFSENPGLSALLELEALAKKESKRS